MSAKSPPRLATHAGGSPSKYPAIATAIRARVVRGELAAGARLPTRVELQRTFRATSVTIQKALSQLAREGFVEARGRQGTFVPARLPHQSHYALAFQFPHDEKLSQFYTALRHEAGRFESDGRHFSIFHQIGEHTDTEDYQRLLGFVRSHRLAGLIFAQATYAVLGTPMLDEPDVPRVIVASADASGRGIPAVYFDLDAFIPRALDFLAQRGRQRVAMFTAAGLPYSHAASQFVREAAARGLRCEPHWIQIVHPHGACWAQNIAQLLARSRPRPDGLVIVDDNVVEPVTAGIAAAHWRVPQELEIVAHTNFPWPTPSAVPVRRLGYDVRHLLELCVARVDALRRGEQPPPVTLLPALFEEELTRRQSLAGLATPVATEGKRSHQERVAP